VGRVHLFELEDQSWFPELIRDAGTAYLAFAARIARQSDAIAPILKKALQRSGENRIVDLCSGGSGPLPGIARAFDDAGEPFPRVTLTDFYPNRGAFEHVLSEDDRFSAVYESIDARLVPNDLKGLRTIFSGFHHFRPADAQQILSDAAEDGAPIAIFEVVARHPLALLGMFLAPLTSLIFVPFLRPFRWGWLPFTYLVPLIPLFIFWDGFVSCLRCYSQAELHEMTAAIPVEGYAWEIGSMEMFGAPFAGCYLIGTPSEV